MSAFRVTEATALPFTSKEGNMRLAYSAITSSVRMYRSPRSRRMK